MLSGDLSSTGPVIRQGSCEDGQSYSHVSWDALRTFKEGQGLPLQTRLRSRLGQSLSPFTGEIHTTGEESNGGILQLHHLCWLML